MGRVNASLRDLRALGPMAPFRAAYEIGKRTGAHGALLKGLARRGRPLPLRSLTEFAAPLDITGGARQRCLADAEQILTDGHRAFGTRLPIGGPDDWSRLGTGALVWPTGDYWWNIDIRTDSRIGDVKWTWELGRHRDLVVLARAAHLEPGGRWLDALSERLRWWFAATPAERSVHWYSNLEISLRIIAWIQIHALVGGSLPQDVQTDMALHVDLARRHLLVDFPYTMSSMRNNHLLGDALGLLAVQRFTGHDDPDDRLTRLAEKSFADQLARHMRADGSMIEDSLSYHRFVLEMLATKVLLGDQSAATAHALRGAAEHLERLGAFAGALPQWGDWDEGRVLASSGDELDVAGSTALGLALTGPTHTGWAERYDEVAWYAPATGAGLPPAGPEERSESGAVSSGGISHATVGPWHVWLKGGTGPSHQHADLTHLSIRHGEDWVVTDPGTGTYNGELAVRNAFRTSRSHNGLRVDDEEMFVPHRAFRWLTSASAASGRPLQLRDHVVLAGLHDAYRRTEGGRVARVVVVSPDWVCAVDWRESGRPAAVTVALTPEGLPPGVSLFGLGSAVPVTGQTAPVAGYWSRTYGDWVPATWLDTTVTGSGPSVWGTHLLDAPPTVAVDGQSVTIGAVSVTLTFAADGARVLVDLDGAAHPIDLDGVPA